MLNACSPRTSEESQCQVSHAGEHVQATRSKSSPDFSTESSSQEGSAVSAVDVVLQVFRSVEERDPQLAVEVYHDDLEFHWPRPLPYAGSSYGLKASLERRPGWAQTWDPFRGPSDHGLGARVVAASEDEVVVLWHQRGRDRAGRELDTPVLGLYRVRDGKLARAQMFYFDPLAAAEFLAAADADT